MFFPSEQMASNMSCAHSLTPVHTLPLRHAELLGIDHGVVGPAHDVAPLVVAVAHQRAERLFRDDLGQHDVFVGVPECEALSVKGRHIP